MRDWLRQSWVQTTLTVLVTAAIAFEMARLEVVRRAKRDFHEGEKYYRWYLDPAAKAKELAAERDAKAISVNEYEHLMEEDLYKEAVVWWQDEGDFYYLPHSSWVDLAEDRIWETGQEHERRGMKAGLKKGRDDLEHALMAYKAIVDSWRPINGRDAGRHLEAARLKVAELEAKGMQWP